MKWIVYSVVLALAQITYKVYAGLKEKGTYHVAMSPVKNITFSILCGILGNSLIYLQYFIFRISDTQRCRVSN